MITWFQWGRGGGWRRYVDARVIRRNIRSALVEHELVQATYGDSRVRRRVSKHLQRLMDDAEVSINFRADRLDRFLRDGRFKTAFDLPPQEGAQAYLEWRDRLEVSLFGERIRTMARPVTGSVGNSYETSALAIGKIRVVLRPEVKARSTFTRADSMNMLPPRLAVPMREVDAVVFSSIPAEDLLVAYSMDDVRRIVQRRVNSMYIEAQVHGGLTPADVLRIEVPDGFDIGRETQRWAAEHDIAIVVIARQDEVFYGTQ